MIKEDSHNGLKERKFSRVKENIFILQHLKSGNPDKFMAITCDIGGGGLMFETERSILQGETLDFEIYQPIDPRKIIFFSILAKAKVIWSRKIDKDNFGEGENKYRVGVEFLEINGEDRKRVDTYVKKLC